MRSSVRELRRLRNQSTGFLSRKSPNPSSTQYLLVLQGDQNRSSGQRLCYEKLGALSSSTVLGVEVSVEFEIQIFKAEGIQWVEATGRKVEGVECENLVVPLSWKSNLMQNCYFCGIEIFSLFFSWAWVMGIVGSLHGNLNLPSLPLGYVNA